MSNHHQSDVARLREQIERETEAMQQGLYGSAITARHDLIAHRYDAMEQYHNELILLVGQEEAANILTDAYSQVMEKGAAQ